jgi:drug/metabolite transporter (DMT)-like permease
MRRSDMPVWIGEFKGELAALSAAFVWAMSSVVYARMGQRIPPLELNLLKGGIAIGFLLLTVLVRGQLLPALDAPALGMLSLSGVIGITLGDTAYFAGLNSIGPRRTLLLETLAPPMTALLAAVFLGEQLGSGAWIGILLTVLGVAWVIGERVTETAGKTGQWVAGVRWALLAGLAQAGGAVLSRAALAQTEIEPVWGALVRLSAGVLGLLLWARLGRKPLDGLLKPLQSRRVLVAIVVAAFASTYLGIWLQQTALKFAPAGIAQTLSATSPLFVLPLAVWAGDRVSLRAILGVLVALAGVGILFSWR